jgi:low density lipoprotein-related protein 2
MIIKNNETNNIYSFPPFRFKRFSDESTLGISPLVPNELNYVENMAFDWISRNLYFTNYGKISVVKYETPGSRRDVIRQYQVHALAVDPYRGYLFYSSLARPAKIHRAYLDGTNITVIAQGGFSLPYSISLDYANRKAYWCDAHLNKIMFVDYTGANVATLFSSTLIMPLSIFVYKYYVYLIDGQLSNVYRITKFGARTPSLIRSNVNNAYQLKIYSSETQAPAENHPCARQNGDCSHFCFGVPSPNPLYVVSRHCGCPFGFKLDTNMMTCITNADEQTVNKCEAPYYFKCSNNRCIR